MTDVSAEEGSYYLALLKGPLILGIKKLATSHCFLAEALWRDEIFVEVLMCGQLALIN